MKYNVYVFNGVSVDSRVKRVSSFISNNGNKVKIFGRTMKIDDELVKLKEVDVELVYLPNKIRQINRFFSKQKSIVMSLLSKMKSNFFYFLFLCPVFLLMLPIGIVLSIPYFVFKLIPKQKLSFINILMMIASYHKRCSNSVDFKADAYYCNDLNTLLIGYIGKRRHKGILIYDSHEYYTDRNVKNKNRFLTFWLKKYEKFLIKKCDYVITVCHSIKEQLELDYDIKDIIVVRNTPYLSNHIEDENIFREIYDIRESEKILLYCGSITFNRGIEKLIEAMEKLEGYRLIFLGYGTEHYISGLQDLIISHNLDDRIHFYGKVESTQVARYISMADYGVSPIQNVCLSYYLCLPNKVFEYIQGGIPIVCSNFPEMKKVVVDEGIGYSFDPECVDSIVESIEILDREYTKNYKRIDSNLLRMKSELNWENECKNLFNVIK